MDLETLERLALDADRSAALSTLLPGTAEHDYWRGVFLLHEGRLDEVREILDTWQKRHGQGDDALREQLKRRHLLLRATRDLGSATAELKREAGVSLDDRAEVVIQAQRYPTKLDPSLVDTGVRLREELVNHRDLSSVTNLALRDVARLVAVDDAVPRRALLQRLTQSNVRGLLQLIAADLEDKTSSRFGSLGIHARLTIEELEELAAILPGLRHQTAWVDAMLLRLRPESFIDPRIDLVARQAFLERVWAFVTKLAPAFNTLKAQVLYRRLELDRARGVFDRARFVEYLGFPRNAPWVPRQRYEGLASTELVQPGAFAARAAGIEPIGDDTPLLRDYFARFLAKEDGRDFEKLVRAEWLETERATARLLAGVKGAEAERCAKSLGAAAVEALRDRVDIELAPQNPIRFEADDEISLEVDVKNVPVLEVKVFRINTLAYFLAKGTDVTTALDLDGMVSGGEGMTLRFDTPPLERVRRKIDLPGCRRPGTYVVELIGNGRSSRALVRKGGLRHTIRISAAGPVLTILDERGTPLAGARAWLGGRELVANENGVIVIPFSTRPGRVPVLLVHGDVTQLTTLDHPAEQVRLFAGLHLERESLVPGQTAKILCRPTLAIAGEPTSISLLEDARLDLTVTDLAGTSTQRSQPISLADDAESVIELNVPENTVHVAVRLRGQVLVVSTQKKVDVEDGAQASINEIHATDRIASLHLARVEGGRMLVSLLGKTGEALGGIALAFVLKNEKLTHPIDGTLETDENGNVDLGILPDIVSVQATLPSGASRWWDLERPVLHPRLVHALAQTEITLPIHPRTRSEEIQVVELRGGAPARDVTAHARIVDRALVLESLPPGDYEILSDREPTTKLVVAPKSEHPEWARAGETMFQLTRKLPLVRSFVADAGHAVLRLSNVSPETRVHFVATRFRDDPMLNGTDLRRTPRVPWAMRDERPLTQYVSGRDIGEEYRYVLERRNAPRRPGTLLEKPGLLLNPWPLRTTTTERQEAAVGGAYGATAGAPAMSAPAPRPASMAGPGGFGGGGGAPATPTVDFLARNAVVIANLRPDAEGFVRVPLAELEPAQLVRAFVIDPELTSFADLELPPTKPAPRDLRLRLALDPSKHFAEDRAVEGVQANTTLIVPDVRTGKIELVDTIARAHQLLGTLGEDSSLREFAFVADWPTFDARTKRERYSKYACHELHLFLWKKDPELFESVVRPYLAHKRHKTFVDHFLLGDDLRAYLKPWAFHRLNAVERILLGQRIPEVKDVLARLIGDAVDILAPDPERDAQLLATLLGASALEAPVFGMAAAAEEMDLLADEDESPKMMERAVDRSERQKNKKVARPAKEESARAISLDERGGGGYGAQLAADAEGRRRQEPMFRSADKTQEWAETSWWKRRIEESGPDIIEPNRFWRDLAKHRGDAPFLSPWLADCAGSFSASLCALAFLDLPFVAAPHDRKLEDITLTVTPKSHVLAARTRIADIEADANTSSGTVLIGQSYFRSDDRYDWEGPERREKYVTGEMIVGVVYVCQVVVTNPTSAEQKLDVLLQIPKGALPVANGFLTKTSHLSLDPHATSAIEYAFYFPRPGRFTHFPAHVTSTLPPVSLRAFAAAREIDVTREPTTVDLGSWAHVSQQGTLDDLIAFLERTNLGRIDLERIAWRMHDRTAFTRITASLAARHTYHDRLWSYALAHGDTVRFEEWLGHQEPFLHESGPVIEGVDPIARGWFQHLEYAPLINARAHQLGARRRILNSALGTQYRSFLELVAHRPKVSSDDLLGAAQYLLTMDRVDEALLLLGRVEPTEVATRLQHDYLAAYCACYRGDLAAARRLAAPWGDHPVDRWRNRFLALVGMLDEVERGSTGPSAVIDEESRVERMNESAARQPALEIAASGLEILLQHHNLGSAQLRFYKMDIELLFSRQPFVQGDVERFSFIEPGHVETVSFAGDGRTTIPIPEGLRGANVVIEAVGESVRRAVVHYAHDLGVQLSQAYGQLRVVRSSTQSALPSTYVKVYGRQKNGQVAFFKDGYTDLRGRFDYATLSTDDLDRVERFAILVVSDDAGATILEANPPPR